MTARQEFEHAAERQLEAAYRRGAAAAAQLLNGHINRERFAADIHVDVTAELLTVTRAGQQLAAAYTGAVLATVGAGQDEEGPVFYAAHAVTAGRLALARVPRQEAAR